MTHKQLEKIIFKLSDVRLEYPFGPMVAVYKTKINKSDSQQNEWKMFALIAEDKKPVRISLKCDPKLSELLRDKYESVMPGYHLNKKHWNTIVLTGQLSDQEISDLILHSYILVK